MRFAPLVAVLAALVAGCGSCATSKTRTHTVPTVTAQRGPAGAGAGTKPSVAQYKTVVKQLMSQVQQVASDRPAPSAGAGVQADWAQRLQSAVQQAHDQLAQLHPPGNYEVANKAIAGTFGQFATLLGQLATAARKHDAAAVRKIAAEVQALTGNLKSSLATLQQMTG